MVGANAASPMPKRRYTPIICNTDVLKHSRKELNEMMSRPVIMRRFRPRRSERMPNGRERSAAMSRKEALIAPTSKVSAPSVRAKSGTSGIRKYEPR